jgi:hypothetical protein
MDTAPRSPAKDGIVILLKAGTDELKECAAYALGFLAYSQETEVAMVEEGVVALLVGLVKEGTELQKYLSAKTLAVLANYDPTSTDIIHEGAIPAFVALLRGGTDEQTEGAAYALRNLAVT